MKLACSERLSEFSSNFAWKHSHRCHLPFAVSYREAKSSVLCSTGIDLLDVQVLYPAMLTFNV